MGATDTTAPQPVTTRTEASDLEVDSAIIWAVRRRKALAGVVVLVFGGAGLGWTALQGIQAEAEDRVLRRQAADKQAEAVLANGLAVGELHKRMARVESDISAHTDMTRMSIEMLMASTTISPDLRARAAGFVSGSE